MNFLSLFSGIGGLDFGLERAGMKCVAQVEIDPFCRRVLAKHWPDVPRFEDVRTVTAENLPAGIDCICGGFPCQDISVAGYAAGLDGERSGLWYQYLRIIREIRPKFVIVENVPALLSRGLGVVLGGLAECRLDAEWRVFSANEFGAPHERGRVFIVAYANEVYGKKRMGHKPDGKAKIFRGRPSGRNEFWTQAPPRSVRVDHGIPATVYSDRVSALGNAVVPQVAEWIGRQIMNSIQETRCP
jgi:DNA (cytosine-5)-methyltransferase 1